VKTTIGLQRHIKMKAILLVGGFGTRLKSVVGDIPKPMADINGKPFLEHLLNYLHKQGVDEFILSVHHLKEKIIDYFGDNFNGAKIIYAIEDEPLGTGGAVLNAMNCVNYDDDFLVLNGDCFQEINLKSFLDSRFHENNKAHIVLTLRQMPDTFRYGRVEVDSKKIISFKEKGISGEGLINAGIYLIDSKFFKSQNLPKKFSIETDFFAQFVKSNFVPYYIASGNFIDIGTPEDYELAKRLIKYDAY
jgi:D-glycero-alpha-D-manno-heptose 1-phosphate guanylyltransferase